MSYKIEGIQRPDIKHPDTWASVLQTRIDWLRQIGPQMGIDTPRAILGEVLGGIYGDDGNSFGFYFLDAKLMEQAKRNLQIRMDIEINTPELPIYIRDRIKTIKLQVLSIDWTKEEGYKKAKKLWKKEVSDFVQHQLAMNKEYREAVRYSLSIGERLSPPWSDFLYGSHVE